MTKNNHHLPLTLYRIVSIGWKAWIYMGFYEAFPIRVYDSKLIFLYKLMNKLWPGGKWFGQVHWPVHPGLELILESYNLMLSGLQLTSFLIEKKEKALENMGGGSQCNLGTKQFDICIHVRSTLLLSDSTMKKILVISFPWSDLFSKTTLHLGHSQWQWPAAPQAHWLQWCQ